MDGCATSILRRLPRLGLAQAWHFNYDQASINPLGDKRIDRLHDHHTDGFHRTDAGAQPAAVAFLWVDHSQLILHMNSLVASRIAGLDA